MNQYQFEDLISDYVENKLTFSKRKDAASKISPSELHLSETKGKNCLNLFIQVSSVSIS